MQIAQDLIIDLEATGSSPYMLHTYHSTFTTNYSGARKERAVYIHLYLTLYICMKTLQTS